MNDQLQKTIADVIQKLAAQLGVATEYLWGVLVKGMHAQGIADLAIALPLAILSVAILLVVWPKTKDIQEGDGRDASRIVTVIVSGALMAGAIVGFYWGLICLYAPEYAALLKVLDAVKNAR